MNEFEKFLLEVKESDIKKIGSRINKFVRKEQTEPFNDIFDGKVRIVLPLESDNKIKFENYLKEFGLTNIDLKKGTADRITKTNQGEKKQQIRIGKFLEKLKEEKANNWLSWWEQNKSGINEENLSIVVSRHPIDLLRMSDFDNISSCHSPGKAWFKCALQEARTGGAIAYIIPTSEINKIKNIQTKEIFKDKKRKIEGIEPLTRIRLRRFTDGKNDYLIPELKYYGEDNAGFYDTVKNWLLNVQAKKLVNPDFSKMKLMGGSYQDESSSKIWSEFLDKPIKMNNNEKEIGKSEIDENRIQEILNGHVYQHYNVIADLTELEGQDFIDCYTDVGFEIDGLINKENINYKLEEYIKDELDIYRINNVEIATEGEKVKVFISLNDEEAQNTLESLENWLDTVDTYDKEYSKQKKLIESILWKHDVITLPIDDVELKNLEMLPYEKELPYGKDCEFESEKFGIGSLVGLRIDDFPVENKSKIIYDLTNKLPTFYVPSIQSEILGEIKKNISIGNVIALTFEIKSDESVEGTSEVNATTISQNNPNAIYSTGKVWGKIIATIDEHDKETIKQLVEIDELIPSIKRLIISFWKKITESHKPNANNSEYVPKFYASNILNYIHYKKFSEGGEIYAKDNKYYYKNQKEGVDELASTFIDRSEKFLAEYKYISDSIKYSSPAKAYGDFIMRYKNGQPHGFWQFDNNKMGIWSGNWQHQIQLPVPGHVLEDEIVPIEDLISAIEKMNSIK